MVERNPASGAIINGTVDFWHYTGMGGLSSMEAGSLGLSACVGDPALLELLKYVMLFCPFLPAVVLMQSPSTFSSNKRCWPLNVSRSWSSSVSENSSGKKSWRSSVWSSSYLSCATRRKVKRVNFHFMLFRSLSPKSLELKRNELKWYISQSCCFLNKKILFYFHSTF